MKLEAKIRSQNDDYFKIYDYIVANVRKDDQIRILAANNQLPLIALQDDQVNELVVNITGRPKIANSMGCFHFVTFF